MDDETRETRPNPEVILHWEAFSCWWLGNSEDFLQIQFPSKVTVENLEGKEKLRN